MRLVLVTVLLVGCSHGEQPALEPLISGSIEAACGVEQLDLTYGYATTFDSNTRLILLGGPTTNLRCGSSDDVQHDVFQLGQTVQARLPFGAFDDVGDYTTDIVVRGIILADLPVCVGGGTGTVSITHVGDTIAGSLSVDGTRSPVDENSVGASGTFEIVHCTEP